MEPDHHALTLDFKTDILLRKRSHGGLETISLGHEVGADTQPEAAAAGAEFGIKDRWGLTEAPTQILGYQIRYYETNVGVISLDDFA